MEFPLYLRTSMFGTQQRDKLLSMLTSSVSLTSVSAISNGRTSFSTNEMQFESAERSMDTNLYL